MMILTNKDFENFVLYNIKDDNEKIYKMVSMFIPIGSDKDIIIEKIKSIRTLFRKNKIKKLLNN